MEDFKPFPHFATNALHVGQEPEQWKSMAVVPPISMSTTFKQFAPADHAEDQEREVMVGSTPTKVKNIYMKDSSTERVKVSLWRESCSMEYRPGDYVSITDVVTTPYRGEVHLSLTSRSKIKGFEYSRSGNPTRNCLEACLASLENAKHGMVFSSGLAASNTCTFLLQKGDHILSMDDLYGGTNRLFRQCTSRMGIDVSFVDCCDVRNVEAAIRQNTKMVWIETPTNPTLKLVDIAAVVQVTRQKAHKDCFVVVDNTFMSSFFQRPLDHGADMVMHSLTKYMNGHSDVVMGCICTNSNGLAERLRFLQNAIGPVPSPFDSFLVNRGLKTLAVRMKEHMKNGLAVAKFLEADPRVEKVIHPGLPTHPQYELAKRQMKGTSGMCTVYIKGDKKQTDEFLKNLKVFTLAESLGGFESLAELPAVMTHASVPAEDRVKLGISDNLVRLSVGLEDEEDLIADLDQALTAALGSK